jgi:hypothetical protein
MIFTTKFIFHLKSTHTHVANEALWMSIEHEGQRSAEDTIQQRQ